MSTLKTINIIHPSGIDNNIVADSSGNITLGGSLQFPDNSEQTTAYTGLPVASGNTLGGVKVGAGLGISDGILSVNSVTQSNIQTFLSSGTWVKPTGYSPLSPVLIEVWGAGAGGTYLCGGGGGGYSYRWCQLSDLNTTEAIVVGLGSTGGNEGSVTIQNGGDTYGCGTYAYGGRGKHYTGSYDNGGAGGFGTIRGTDGMGSLDYSPSSDPYAGGLKVWMAGGGGGGATQGSLTSPGIDGVQSFGGGSGGAMGQNGQVPGGGGGGGMVGGGYNFAYGSGANGKAVVKVFPIG